MFVGDSDVCRSMRCRFFCSKLYTFDCCTFAHAHNGAKKIGKKSEEKELNGKHKHYKYVSNEIVYEQFSFFSFMGSN